MQISNISERHRGPSNGAGPGARPPMQGRNGDGGSSGMSKAEKFENEKKRIIESCFAKKDNDGSVLESYITHIRIVEDAAHPSSPPPPDSSQDNKKARLIIVAVRKSGRVRMHKARENPSGTFSIGKTWVLDDLTCINSFAGPAPNDPEEQLRRQWADGVGFIVTVQKPYYWAAGTAKEKDFFIGSLIKIYRKYTGGKLPQLVGFDPRTLDQVTAPPSSQPRANAAPGRSENEAQQLHSPVQGRQLSSTFTTRELAGDGMVEARTQPPSERSMSTSKTEEFAQRPPPGFFPGSDFTKPVSLQESQTQPRVPHDASPNKPSYSSDGLGTSSSSYSEPSSRRLASAQSVGSFRSSNKALDGRLASSSSVDQLRSDRVPSGSSDSLPRSQRSGSPDNQYSSPKAKSSTSPLFYSQQALLPERRRPPLSGSINGSRRDQSGNEPQENSIGFTAKTEMRRQEDRPPSRSGETPRVTASNSSNVSGSGETSLLPTEQGKSSLDTTSAATLDTMDSASLTSTKSDRNFPTTAISHTTPSQTPPPEPTMQSEQEVHRPGLGPMIKKKSNKEIANAFRKAATAYTAFRPRPGGAGDKLREERITTSSGPDGITDVVPAPSLLRPTNEKSVMKAAVGQGGDLPTPLENTPQIPAVEITEADQVPDINLDGAAEALPGAWPSTPGESEAKPPKVQDDRRTKRRSGHTAKYATALGIDPSLLEGATVDIESVLADFGWGSEDLSAKKVDDLQADIRREIGRVEAGSWLGHLEQKDERVEMVDKMLDKAIVECDVLDGLLTLYGVELGTLGEDIAYIEAQSQGLQVQAANQKLLQNELQGLLETISITPSQLQVLREAPLGMMEGLQSAEESLRLLYKAMLRIDPKLRQGDTRPNTSEKANQERSSIGGFVSSEIGNMRALQEKKAVYQKETVLFLQRLKQYMTMAFAKGEQSTSDALERERNSNSTTNIAKLDSSIHDLFRHDVWPYHQLLLFSREVNSFEWEEIMRLYERFVKRPYQEELRDNTMTWKKVATKPIGNEQDLLFTAQEKESDSLASTARKLTVKRAKTMRSLPGDANRTSSGEKTKDGKMYAYEAFSRALDEMVPLVYTEQNFFVEFFHASSLENVDFLDVVTATVPADRTGPNLATKKLFDPDRSMARRVLQVMDEIFSAWPADLQSLVDWAMRPDPLQGVGVLYALELKLSGLEDTNQEYIVRTLQKIRDRVSGLFSRFVEEQIRGIEDTKVKIKKRKGVIGFIKTFPNFATAVENMLPEPESLDPLEVRFTVNDAYQKINKAMFESLKFIAKESPTVMASQHGQGGTADPEDKEALNYHILLIENMNHYIEEVDTRGNIVLEEWRDKAAREMSEHMGLYLSAVIRRPLGKLLDFLESTESLLPATTAPGSPTPTTIATRASHSRSTFKKILAGYDAKEIRRGIDALRKRVEKHFGDADDPGLSRGLVLKVLRQCEGAYLDVGERTRRVVESVYEGGLEVEWRREDVVNAFRR